MKPKPEWNALKTLFSEIVVGKSTLVSDMSKPLRENSSKPERKRAQERVSGWLGNYDFVEATGGWLRRRRPKRARNGVFGRLGCRQKKVQSAFGTGRKYFSANDFGGLVKNRDKLSRKIRDKGVGLVAG